MRNLLFLFKFYILICFNFYINRPAVVDIIKIEENFFNTENQIAIQLNQLQAYIESEESKNKINELIKKMQHEDPNKQTNIIASSSLNSSSLNNTINAPVIDINLNTPKKEEIATVITNKNKEENTAAIIPAKIEPTNKKKEDNIVRINLDELTKPTGFLKITHLALNDIKENNEKYKILNPSILDIVLEKDNKLFNEEKYREYIDYYKTIYFNEINPLREKFLSYIFKVFFGIQSDFSEQYLDLKSYIEIVAAFYIYLNITSDNFRQNKLSLFPIIQDIFDKLNKYIINFLNNENIKFEDLFNHTVNDIYSLNNFDKKMFIDIFKNNASIETSNIILPKKQKNKNNAEINNNINIYNKKKIEFIKTTLINFTDRFNNFQKEIIEKEKEISLKIKETIKKRNSAVASNTKIKKNTKNTKENEKIKVFFNLNEMLTNIKNKEDIKNFFLFLKEIFNIRGQNASAIIVSESLEKFNFENEQTKNIISKDLEEIRRIDYIPADDFKRLSPDSLNKHQYTTIKAIDKYFKLFLSFLNMGFYNLKKITNTTKGNEYIDFIKKFEKGILNFFDYEKATLKGKINIAKEDIYIIMSEIRNLFSPIFKIDDIYIFFPPLNIDVDTQLNLFKIEKIYDLIEEEYKIHKKDKEKKDNFNKINENQYIFNENKISNLNEEEIQKYKNLKILDANSKPIPFEKNIFDKDLYLVNKKKTVLNNNLDYNEMKSYKKETAIYIEYNKLSQKEKNKFNKLDENKYIFNKKEIDKLNSTQIKRYIDLKILDTEKQPIPFEKYAFNKDLFAEENFSKVNDFKDLIKSMLKNNEPVVSYFKDTLLDPSFIPNEKFIEKFRNKIYDIYPLKAINNLNLSFGTNQTKKIIKTEDNKDESKNKNILKKPNIKNNKTSIKISDNNSNNDNSNDPFFARNNLKKNRPNKEDNFKKIILSDLKTTNEKINYFKELQSYLKFYKGNNNIPEIYISNAKNFYENIENILTKEQIKIIIDNMRFANSDGKKVLDNLFKDTTKANFVQFNEFVINISSLEIDEEKDVFNQKNFNQNNAANESQIAKIDNNYNLTKQQEDNIDALNKLAAIGLNENRGYVLNDKIINKYSEKIKPDPLLETILTAKIGVKNINDPALFAQPKFQEKLLMVKNEYENELKKSNTKLAIKN
jgi:hypothetical protein